MSSAEVAHDHHQASRIHFRLFRLIATCCQLVQFTRRPVIRWKPDAGCTSIYPDTIFLDLNQSLESFNSLVTDLDTVEKQMANLLNTYTSLFPQSVARRITQPKLTFQNVFVDDSLDIFPVRKKTPPPESVECSFTPEVNLVVNLTSCKMNSLSGEVDLLTYRLDESDQ